MKYYKIKILFTDLDRTLLRDDDTFSQRSITVLHKLKKKGIVVVIATGRNIHSAGKVLPEDLPIDYLMISSGCGIIDWRTKRVICENHLSRQETSRVLQIMQSQKLDFMVHHPLPDNHCFDFVLNNPENKDFHRRLKIYRSFARKLTVGPVIASQFIAIFPQEELDRFELAKNEINGLQVIRATSPLDHRSIWLEVFPRGVSKGHSAKWLCRKLGIDRKNTIGIGNDFNDIDLLDYTQQSFVVANAPQELKEIYQTIASNQDDGVADLMERKTEGN